MCLALFIYCSVSRLDSGRNRQCRQVLIQMSPSWRLASTTIVLQASCKTGRAGVGNPLCMLC